MLVLEDVLEVDDLAGLGAYGEERDLVENLGGAVDATADPDTHKGACESLINKETITAQYKIYLYHIVRDLKDFFLIPLKLCTNTRIS